MGIISAKVGFPARTFIHNGQLYLRFMDYIGVPCRLDELTTEQIQLINRMREDLIAAAQVDVSNSRRVFESMLSMIEPGNMLELGPGKFPLRIDGGDWVPFYREIDGEAADLLQTNGARVLGRSDGTRDWTMPETLKAICAVNVVHFAIDLAFTRSALVRLDGKGLMLANFIDGNTSMPLALLSLLSDLDLAFKIFRPAGASACEWYVAASASPEILRRIRTVIEMKR